MSSKNPFIILIVVLLVLLITPPGFGSQSEGDDVEINKYSKAVRAVFMRMAGEWSADGIQQEQKTNPAGDGNFEGETDEAPEAVKTPSETGTSRTAGSKEPLILEGVPDFGEKSIMERLREDSTITPGGMVDKINNTVTGTYRVITQSITGAIPLLLVGAAILLVFSRGRMWNWIIILLVAMFLIFNAPEITKVLVNTVTGILN